MEIEIMVDGALGGDGPSYSFGGTWAGKERCLVSRDKSYDKADTAHQAAQLKICVMFDQFIDDGFKMHYSCTTLRL